ncbi:MAG: peptidyl-prolyl cis-trans isomerase [Desulfuromonadales bacterium]|nr:peptidyl-prolyl cis-trans isomerase [Desulfuromonadales bacterium]
MRYFVVILLLVFTAPLPLAAETVSRVAAVVNEDIITTYQLDKALQEQLAEQEQQPSPVQLGALRQELLSRLIEEALVQQRIQALNLTVSEEEVETALLDVQKKNQLTREQLEEAVMVQGLDFDSYRGNLSKQILRYKLIGQEVRSQVDVTEQEVVEYYRAHVEEYRQEAKVDVTTMTFPISEKSSIQEREKIRTQAKEALKRLRQGDAMADVVSAYSETYGASMLELGEFAHSELIPEFAVALAEIESGSYSDPVEAKGALHLLKVEERLPGTLLQFDSMKNEIYQMILDQKTDARIKEWTKALKNRSFIDIRL